MSRTTLALTLTVLAAGLAAVPAGPARADDPPPAAAAPSHDADLAQYLKTLEPQIRSQTDEQSVASVKALLDFWKDPAVSADARKPIPGLVAHYAERRSAPVAMAGIAGLGEIGKGEGARHLLGVVDAALSRKEPPAEILAAAFAALKKAADPAEPVTKSLTKLLQYKDDHVIAQAADALGGYGAAPGDVRKDVFEELLKDFEGVASEARKPGNKSALNKWNVVGSSVMGALGSVAHQSFADPAAARKWFNDHRRDVAAWK